MAKRKNSQGGLPDLIALASKPDSWPGLDEPTLSQLVIWQCLAFGIKGDSRQFDEIAPLYNIFIERFLPDFREQVEQGVAQSLADGNHAKALVPFVVYDPEISVISSEALDFAVLRTPEDEFGPFTGPVLMLALAKPESGLPDDTRAGILTGLVLLGDRRLFPLLDGCWCLLGPEGREILAAARSGYISAGLVEFFLSWLEQTEDESNFGGIIGTLCRMPEISKNGMVQDIERRFPAVSPGNDEEPIRLLQEWTFPQYFKKIRPRLKAIGKRESEPKLIPYIEAHWNAV